MGRGGSLRRAVKRSAAGFGKDNRTSIELIVGLGQCDAVYAALVQGLKSG